jgi:hypothetical protein
LAFFSVGVLIAARRAGTLILPVVLKRAAESWGVEEGIVGAPGWGVEEGIVGAPGWGVEEGVVGAPGWGVGVVGAPGWGCVVRLSTLSSDSIIALFRPTASESLATADQTFFLDYELLRSGGRGNGSVPVGHGLDYLMAPHPSLCQYPLQRAGGTFSTMSRLVHWWRWKRVAYL